MHKPQLPLIIKLRIVHRDDTFDQIKINFHHGIRKKPLHE